MEVCNQMVGMQSLATKYNVSIAVCTSLCCAFVSLWLYHNNISHIRRIRGYYGFMLKLPTASCQPPSTHFNGLFLNLVHTFYLFKHKFLTTFLSCTKLKRGVVTHLSVRLSARPSTFSGFCASADKSLGRYGLYFCVLMYLLVGLLLQSVALFQSRELVK